MSEVEKRLNEMGFHLPECPTPGGAYVPAVNINGFVYASGQVPTVDGVTVYTGKVGVDVTIEEAVEGARICALRLISELKSVVGNLDDIERIAYVQGFVNSEDDFGQQPAVINGASQLLEAAFGEKGRHARIAVGVSTLPGNAAVEVMLVAALK